jgi:hypothetical protein
MPLIPAVGRLRQKDHKFEARLDNTARPCLKERERELNLLIKMETLFSVYPLVLIPPCHHSPGY